MQRYTAFRGTEIIKQSSKFEPSHTLSAGDYVLFDTVWYICISHSLTPINLSDVPKELRALLLIL